MCAKKKEEKKEQLPLTEKEVLTEQKIEAYSKALKSALKEEPPEEQVRILKPHDQGCENTYSCRGR